MKMNLPGKNTLYSASWENFRGADFTSGQTDIDRTRSGKCLNVYKDYTFSPDAIVTRKGLEKIFFNACTLFDVGPVYNMMRYKDSMYIHFGSYLLKYNSFPQRAVFMEPTTSGMSGCHIVGSAMNTKKSDGFVFRDRLYMLDGRKYLFVDEEEYLGYVSDDIAYVPTTRINADPSGGGVIYQEENVLTPFRKNSFLSDGVSTVYYLDGMNILPDSVTAEVDGIEVFDFTVDGVSGTVTFDSPPPLPVTEGADNVVITFSSGIDRSDRIDKCTVCKVFDNRVFLSGNEDYPGLIFHSEFEDATYFALSAYYDDGEDGIPVKSLITAGGSLIAVKENGGCGGKVFIHTPSVDYELGKVYPVMNTPVYLGATGPGVNFNDDMLFLSPRGLEALDFSGSNFRLAHRSSLIDGYLAKYSMEELSDAKMFAWKNYLMIIISGDVFLADGNSTAKINGDYQYDWYFWQFSLPGGEKVCNGISVDENLYFSTTKGNIYSFSGKRDSGGYIKSMWQTPVDYFSSPAYLKNFAKKGNYIRCKIMDEGEIEVSVDTDRHGRISLGRFSLTGFDFSSVDFSALSFMSKGDTIIGISPNLKRFKSASFTVESSDKPFNICGIYSLFTVKQFD